MNEDQANLRNSKVDHLRRKAQKAESNCFLWSSLYNISGIAGCCMPFVLFGMAGGSIPKSKPIAGLLILAWPINYLFKHRPLWSALDSTHYDYLANMKQMKPAK